jgi:hypothetical protein
MTEFRQSGCKHLDIKEFYSGDEVGWECQHCDEVLGAEPYWALSPAQISRLRAEAKRLNPDYPMATDPGRIVELWEKHRVPA